jgi:hypothetical protein
MSLSRFSLCVEARRIVDYQAEQAAKEDEELTCQQRSNLFWARHDAGPAALVDSDRRPHEEPLD